MSLNLFKYIYVFKLCTSVAGIEKTSWQPASKCGQGINVFIWMEHSHGRSDSSCGPDECRLREELEAVEALLECIVSSKNRSSAPLSVPAFPFTSVPKRNKDEGAKIRFF